MQCAIYSQRVVFDPVNREFQSIHKIVVIMREKDDDEFI